MALTSSAAAEEDCTDCRGFAVETVYIGEVWKNTSGGLRTGSTYLDNYELVLSADRGSLGIPGLSAKFTGLYNNANEFSPEFVGDLQVVSNIGAPKAFRIYEAWAEWAPANLDGLTIRGGIYAADQEFDVAPTGALFVNSTGGTGTDYALAGVTGPPIFPLSAFGLRVAGTWGDDGYWMALIADGIPGNPDDFEDFYYRWNGDDGALLQTEFGVENERWRKLAAGAYTYTTEQDTFATLPGGAPKQDRWNTGLYAIMDAWLARGEQGNVAGFLRIGATKEALINRGSFNIFTQYVAGGLTWDSFSGRRPDDQLGILFAAAIAGDEYRDAQRAAGQPAKSHETVIELTYSAQITDWLVLQPDVQYIFNPGLDPALDNALAIGLRFQAEFGKSF